jgi:signal peptidase I
VRPGAAALALTLVVGGSTGLVWAVRTSVVTPVRIDSASMAPTLEPGDVVLVSRWAPDVDDLAHGDLVVFADPREGRRTIKRVVGLPGESVVVLDGVLHVDGAPVEEPWVDPATVDGYYSRTFEVPGQHVFVLGDNRGNSVDSRDYGAVDAEDLRGTVLLGP